MTQINIPYDLDLLRSSNTNQLTPIYQYLTKYLIYPESKHYRFLIKHGTGLGKTRESLQIAKNFIDKNLPVFIFTFNVNIFINDMIKFQELGFVSKSLLNKFQEEKDPNILEQIKHSINKEINQKVTFFGYKEFQNQAFWKEGDCLKLNTILINKMFNSLVICDEIQDVYNMEQQNTWGKSLQMVSNLLGKNIHIVYMSATPLNRPEEVVQLLNLMYVDKNTQDESRDEVMNSAKQVTLSNIEEIQGPIKQFVYQDIPGLIKSIMHNNLSFVPEVTMNQPKANIIGTRYEHIPEPVVYQCPQSDLFKENQRKNEQFMHEDEGKKYIIFDFPNNLTIKDFIFQFQKKNAECLQWAEKNKFQLIYGDNNNYLISGQILARQNIWKYSPKLSSLIELLIKAKGKSFIYINKVKLLGLKLIEQVLRINGIIGINEHIQQNTLCYQCRMQQKAHADQQHDFIPYKFISLYGDQGVQTNEQLLQRYNNLNNVNGQYVQVIIGSKMVKQGVNILHTNNLFVLNIPYNIPNLIQVIGRVVRTGSHALLSPENRYVNIYIMITSSENGEKQNLSSTSTTREEREILAKIQQYMQIQQFEKLMHEVAIDPEIYGNNYFIQDNGVMRQQNTLKMLPFTPQKQFIYPVDKSSYYQQMHYKDLFLIISQVMDQLFGKFQVWLYTDLVESIRSFNIIPDLSKIDDNIIYLVLNKYDDILVKGEYIIKLSGKDIDINWFNPSQKKKKIHKILLSTRQDVSVFDPKVIQIIKQQALNYSQSVSKMELLPNNDNIDKIAAETILNSIFNIKSQDYDQMLRDTIDKRRVDELLVLFLIFVPVSFKQIKQKIQYKNPESDDTIVGFISQSGKEVHYKIDNRWSVIQADQGVVHISQNHLILTSEKTKVIRSNNGVKKPEDKRSQFSGIVCETMIASDVQKFATETQIKFDDMTQKKQLCKELRIQFFQKEMNYRIQFTRKKVAIIQID